jgi:hypothetical protein
MSRPLEDDKSARQSRRSVRSRPLIEHAIPTFPSWSAGSLSRHPAEWHHPESNRQARNARPQPADGRSPDGNYILRQEQLAQTRELRRLSDLIPDPPEI